jgi:small acid-soluble spore protein D (minor alpha/beta-type SASP)
VNNVARRANDGNPAWTQFKMECAQEIGHLQYVKENNDHYKGDVTARQNGLEGGPIGGQMVKKMIAMAKQGMQ